MTLIPSCVWLIPNISCLKHYKQILISIYEEMTRIKWIKYWFGSELMMSGHEKWVYFDAALIDRSKPIETDDRMLLNQEIANPTTNILPRVICWDFKINITVKYHGAHFMNLSDIGTYQHIAYRFSLFWYFISFVICIKISKYFLKCLCKSIIMTLFPYSKNISDVSVLCVKSLYSPLF